jgi:hypothetical protein
LNDGRWDAAESESVQYDSDVSLILDLGAEQQVRKVNVKAFQRDGDFQVGSVTISASSDKQQWADVGAAKNDRAGQAQEDEAVSITSAAATKTRYLKLDVKREPGAKRILLGEIIVEGDAAPPPAEAETAHFTTPMQVKRTLDQALIKAGVPFLFWSYTTELLRDGDGKPAGVVISNRAGRQAVLAKVIIDATEQSAVARMAGAQFTAYPAGTQTFSRVVVGGPLREGPSVTARETTLTIADRKGDAFPVREYQLQIPLRDASFGAFAEAEQLARDLTWTPEAVDGSEVLFQVAPDQFRGRKSLSGPWPGADAVPLECFQPEKVERVFALGSRADVSREAAVKLAQPVEQMALGARVGEAAAALAAQLPKPTGMRVAGSAPRDPLGGVVREVPPETNPRAGAQRIPEEAHGLPVLGEYDVVVVGGGTGGAPAAIGAGRQGAKTLLIEFLNGLGGVGTMGYIASYYHGNRVGFTSQVDEGVAAFGDKMRAGSWNPEHKIEWYRQALRKAGVEVWYGTIGAGAVVEKDRVTGVVVLTPQGRGVDLAKTVIDSTGNADIAAAAGATCRYTDETDISVQGTGLPPRELGQKYTNTDWSFCDDTDVFDTWRMFVAAKMKYRGAYDLGQHIDTRERRQIVGDFTFSPMDMMLNRTFPDTVVVAKSNFDTHGYIIHPMFMIRPPDRASITVHVPWRCLLPRGLDRIIVTGLGVSAHRDALPCIRMQADVQNQGYAAGTAAAMIAKQGVTTREFDIKALQKHLIDVGNLSGTVLTETDSFPLPRETVARAVEHVVNNYDDLEIVLAHFETAQPLLREAFAAAEKDDAKLRYAHILGMMGDPTGAEVLAAAVAAAPWDKGWRYTGLGQYGASMSPLDSLIVALGRTKSSVALPPIVEKVRLLGAEAEFSHFRAITIALETLADQSAAQPLAELLQKPGLGGHAVTTITAALAANPPSPGDTSTRNKELSELYLARALYRCGDHEGLGEMTLREYAADLHGHYARHAQAILKTGKASK